MYIDASALQYIGNYFDDPWNDFDCCGVGMEMEECWRKGNSSFDPWSVCVNYTGRQLYHWGCGVWSSRETTED